MPCSVTQCLCQKHVTVPRNNINQSSCWRLAGILGCFYERPWPDDTQKHTCPSVYIQPRGRHWADMWPCESLTTLAVFAGMSQLYCCNCSPENEHRLEDLFNCRASALSAATVSLPFLVETHVKVIHTSDKVDKSEGGEKGNHIASDRIYYFSIQGDCHMCSGQTKPSTTAKLPPGPCSDAKEIWTRSRLPGRAGAREEEEEEREG